MHGISRNIVMSVMLHSALLAAVFAIGNSGMQQTKRLLIVSLLDEWQQGETDRPVQSSAAGSATKAPAALPLQSRPGRRNVSTVKIQDTVSDVHAGDGSAPAAQTPAAPAEKSVEPDGIPEGLRRGFQGEAAGGRQGTTIGVNPAMSSGKYGPETGGAGTGSAGGERQAEDVDPAFRGKIRDRLQTNLVYPYLARKKRIEGTVLAEFRLNNSGIPENMRIVRSSNYVILDEAAKETIQKAGPFPARNRRVEIPITFRLKDRE